MVFNEPVTYVSEHPLPMFPGHTTSPAMTGCDWRVSAIYHMMTVIIIWI
jgi:hypothetical protein